MRISKGTKSCTKSVIMKLKTYPTNRSTLYLTLWEAFRSLYLHRRNPVHQSSIQQLLVLKGDLQERYFQLKTCSKLNFLKAVSTLKLLQNILLQITAFWNVIDFKHVRRQLDLIKKEEIFAKFFRTLSRGFCRLRETYVSHITIVLIMKTLMCTNNYRKVSSKRTRENFHSFYIYLIKS